MTDRERYLSQWGYQDGTPEADEAWAAKLAFRPLDIVPTIISDISAYQAMGTDIATGKAPVITSRSQHREYLKRNGYVEVGNEQPKSTSEQPINPREIGREIKHAIDRGGYRL